MIMSVNTALHHRHFGERFEGQHRLHCCGHLLDNVLKRSKPAHEFWHQNMFWELQGSKTKEEALTNFDKFRVYPKTFE